MLKKHIVFTSLILLASSCFSQKLQFDGGQTRYHEKHDAKAGITVVDRDLGLEFTKCFAGMESTKENPACSGTPLTLSWDDAVRLSKQAGRGWRLPTADELAVYASSNEGYRQLNRGWRGDSYGAILWTSQGVTGRLDSIKATFKWSISSHPSGGETPRVEDSNRSERYYVLLVRIAR